MEVGSESGGDARTGHTLGHTREHGREGPRCMREREQRGSWTRTDPGGCPSQPRRSALQAFSRLGPGPEEPRRRTGPEQRRRANERGVQRALSAKSGRLSGSVRLRGVGNDAALRAAPSNVLSLCSLRLSLRTSPDDRRPLCVPAYALYITVSTRLRPLLRPRDDVPVALSASVLVLRRVPHAPAPFPACLLRPLAGRGRVAVLCPLSTPSVPEHAVCALSRRLRLDHPPARHVSGDHPCGLHARLPLALVLDGDTWSRPTRLSLSQSLPQPACVLDLASPQPCPGSVLALAVQERQERRRQRRLGQLVDVGRGHHASLGREAQEDGARRAGRGLCSNS